MTKRREQEWEGLVRLARRVEDDGPHRTRLDRRILPVVVGLWAHGIPTQFSCEGHVYADGRKKGEWTGGYFAPYVDIAADEPESDVLSPWELREAHDRGDKITRALIRRTTISWNPWRLANHRLQARVVDLLGEFHERHAPAKHEDLLTLMTTSFWGDFRLLPVSAESCLVLPRKAQVRRLARFHEVLGTLAGFLRESYLALRHVQPPYTSPELK